MANAVAAVAAVLMLLPVAAAGQNTVTIFSEETQGYERIGTALIECTYRYAWLQDTTSGTRMTPEGTLLSGDSTDIAEDVMLLQCGGPDGISRFYSYSQYYRDSLITSLVQTMIDNMMDWFEVVEAVPDFGWVVTDEWKELLGYRVRRAECSFRGRDYVAWFAPELPLSEGPWKFCGLPGLVMTSEGKEVDPNDPKLVNALRYEFQEILE